MKKIAIFLNGTWNELGDRSSTNVVKLVRSVEKYACDPQAPRIKTTVPQMVYYDDGVGSKAHVSPMVDTLTQWQGGIWGWGLEAKLEAAYRFLILNYDPGNPVEYKEADELYIFGFSRGAFTARSLVGLIRKCGILQRKFLSMVPTALKLYARADLLAQDAEMKAFRNRYTHGHIAYGPEDLDEVHTAMTTKALLDSRQSRGGSGLFNERELRGLTSYTDEQDVQNPYLYHAKAMCKMMYVGLWDTVGSLGLPESLGLLAKAENKKYAFHDLSISSMVTSARHACAIDEDRKSFALIPIDNIFELNAMWAAERHYNLIDAKRSDYIDYKFRPFQQKWFPGDHGAVGGGNLELGLSSCALSWVAEGAYRAGLNFDCFDENSVLTEAKFECNPNADWHVDKGGNPTKGTDIIGRLTGLKKRKASGNLDEYSDSALKRYLTDNTYRPDNAPALKRASRIERDVEKPLNWPAIFDVKF